MDFRPTQKQQPALKLDAQQLHDNKELGARYNPEIKNRFEALGNLHDDVVASWKQIAATVIETATSVIGQRQRPRKPWMSPETFEILQDKAKARLHHNIPQRRRLQSIFRSKAIADKESLMRNNLKPAYLAIRKMSKPADATSITKSCINKSDGSPCSGLEETLSRWSEHYQQCLNHPPAAPCSDLDTEPTGSVDTCSTNIDAPTLDEVRRAIMKLKNNKAAGCDSISAELLKFAIGPISVALHELFQKVWASGRVPSEWKEGIIVSLYKGKGKKSECCNYRPITLLSVPGKVFAHVLLARIEPLLVSRRRPQQSGFTAGRSTADAILALRLLSEIHREFNRPLYVAYLDLKSAFDSVDRTALWKAMQKVGVAPFLLKLIEDLHSGTKARIRLGKHMSDSFHTNSGVRQGCILAPALFCRAIDWIMEHLSIEFGTYNLVRTI